ncbi:MAG: recombinase family protein [Oscillospiraceae bacterium]
MQKSIRKIENTTPKMPVRKRVCAYARVSAAKAAQLSSLAAQVSYYASYIQHNPQWEYVGVFADEALSGTKENRKEFLKMIGLCKQNQVDLIITKSISRFARNTVTLLETVRKLKTWDVDVFFEEQNIHTMSSDGELMLTILASYAQEESLSASENNKWRIRKDFAEGKANNFNLYGFDRINSKLIVNETEAKVVKMIYTDYLSGMGINVIVKKLTKNNIPTKYGGKWSESVVHGMLTNEKMIGDTLMQKVYSINHLAKKLVRNKGELPMYYATNTHEPIIDKTTFDAVQKEIACRSQKTISKHLIGCSELTGMIHCKKCGANFRRKTNNRGTSSQKIIWTCGTYNTRGKSYCDAKQIPEYILHNLICEVLHIDEYRSKLVSEQIKCIEVPDNWILNFVLADNTEITKEWKNPSRKDSWTNEMKEKARLKARKKNG